MKKHHRHINRPGSQGGLLACLIVTVCAVVLAAHWPVLSAQAQFFDDHQYLTQNPLVQNPGWASARRFLTEVLEPSTVRGYYQPLAMISLMLDYASAGQGDNLMPFHRTTLILHTANTALVIILLYMLFGRATIAAGVGLLFGVHPMTVESLAWISERKTLLAAFFALWSLVLYVRYSRKGNWKSCIGCMIMYVLALMSKPTALPLPVLMLLMDYWPLKRFNRRCILEKLPLLLTGSVFAIITYLSQSRAAGVILPTEYRTYHIPLVICHNIVFYLYKIICPFDLSPYYALPESLDFSEPMILAGVIGTCILIPLLVISIRWTRALLTGWLFFFIAILPTMQIIGFSSVIAADKFVYLPSIGLLMILAWFLCLLCPAARPNRPRVVIVIVVLILATAETVSTRRYLAHWRDTVSLCKHMLKITPNAVPVLHLMGRAFELQGKLDEAAVQYRKAIRPGPGLGEIYSNLARTLQLQGKLDEAVEHYRKSLRLKDDYAPTYNNLGDALRKQGKFDEAIKSFRRALEIKPDYVSSHYNLALTFHLQGRLDEAIRHYETVVKISPAHIKALNNLGAALHSQKRLTEAADYLNRAIRIRPDSAEAHNNLGAVLRAQGKLDLAIYHFQLASQIDPDFSDAKYNLNITLKLKQKQR